MIIAIGACSLCTDPCTSSVSWSIVLTRGVRPTPGRSVRKPKRPWLCPGGCWAGTWCVGSGQRRFARHWSVAQLRAELADTYQIRVSDDAIERYLHRYQHMLAARQQDPQQLAAAYAGGDAVSLAIDGLQPEKGHETLYVVRELTHKRVWFAEALLSSATAEVQQLLARARRWAEHLGTPVRLWMSDKQHAFVRGIAAEFPGVPHRYCANHFLRDTAKPVLEADSRAKVQMRRKVRGLRAIEREVLAAQRTAAPPEPASAASERPPRVPSGRTMRRSWMSCRIIVPPSVHLERRSRRSAAGPGLRMAEALGDVQASLHRNLAAQKRGPSHERLARLGDYIDPGSGGHPRGARSPATPCGHAAGDPRHSGTGGWHVG